MAREISPSRGARLRFGEVAERSIATDCKSVAPVATKVRILASPPTFARRSSRVTGSERTWTTVGGQPSREQRLIDFVDGLAERDSAKAGQPAVVREGERASTEAGVTQW